MKKRKSIFENIFLISMVLLFILFVCGIIGIEIYVWTTYGNTELSDIPLWALFFMFRRR